MLNILFLFIVGLNGLISEAPYFYNNSRPLVIGHRGSPGNFPEHTEVSYSDAYLSECDFIELDL